MDSRNSAGVKSYDRDFVLFLYAIVFLDFSVIRFFSGRESGILDELTILHMKTFFFRMRFRISTRGCVGPSVGPSVRHPVRPFVGGPLHRRLFYSFAFGSVQ